MIINVLYSIMEKKDVLYPNEKKQIVLQKMKTLFIISIQIIMLVFITSCNQKKKEQEYFESRIRLQEQIQNDHFQDLRNGLENGIIDGVEGVVENDSSTVRGIVKEKPELLEDIINWRPSQEERIKAQRDYYLKRNVAYSD